MSITTKYEGNYEYANWIFVCWTKQDILVERIHHDSTYMPKTLPLLKTFFCKYLLPDILTKNLLVGTCNTEADSDNDDKI